MSTRSIRTSTPQTTCDVCGRTLLRGERAEVYLAGTARHSVCELCTARALHGGWVREGTVPDYGPESDRVERRLSLLRRRSRRRGDAGIEPVPDAPPAFADEFFADAAPETESPAARAPEPPAVAPNEDAGVVPGAPAAGVDPAPDWPEPPARAPRRARRRRSSPLRGRMSSARDTGDAPEPRDSGSTREPRRVHAVPTSVEHKVEAAIELFNGSEFPRTVAGIARSLGLPDVAVHPTSPVAAIVNVLVSWELCWYRYEVDLSEGAPVVRGAGQGYELAELSELERDLNATADELGRLTARQ